VERTETPNHFVLVYDTGARIGWYIPQACIILHMAHHYLSQQRLDLVDAENQPISLDYVEKGGTNAGATAAEILHHSLDYKTRRRTTSKRRHPRKGYCSASCMTGNESDQFENTVERLWYLLDTIGSTLKMNRSEYLNRLKASHMAFTALTSMNCSRLKAPKRSLPYDMSSSISLGLILLTNSLRSYFARTLGKQLSLLPKNYAGLGQEFPGTKIS
jgi:hypothetical protein